MTDNVQQNLPQDLDRIYINRKKPIITYALIAICVVIFFADQITGKVLFGYFNMGYLSLFGMKINSAISEGEIWRMITSVFLHANAQHIVFNMLALYIWGRNIEALYGRKNMLYIFLLAGLLGSFASYAFSNANGLGASGAIYGLLGAFFYVYFYNKKFFLAHFKKQIFIYAAISLAYGFILPDIDNFAHIFGLIGGFLSAGILGLIKQVHKRKTLQCIIIYTVIAVICGVIGYVYT